MCSVVGRRSVPARKLMALARNRLACLREPLFVDRMSKPRTVVIGSGFGGLAIAARLCARGHQVELFEKLDKPGGRAYTFTQDGFTFDGGPTVITAPFLFDELFAMAGRKRGDYVEFIPYQSVLSYLRPSGQLL
jgi:phytoene dehydrogenase-like protein